MHKTIYLVYQDCPLCGDKGKVEKVKIQKVAKRGVRVEKLSFASPKCNELKVFKHAVEQGKGKMPFYFDPSENKVAYDLTELLPVKKKKNTKVQKARKGKTTPKMVKETQEA